MSFSFTAIGKRHEVIAQVRSHGNEESPVTDVRDLVVRFLETHTAHTRWASGTAAADYAYIVKASGHHGSPASLNISIEPLWVPEPAPETVQLSIAKDETEALKDAVQAAENRPVQYATEEGTLAPGTAPNDFIT